MLRNWIAGAVMALLLGFVAVAEAEDMNADIAMIEKLLSGEPAVEADFQPAFLAAVPITQLNAILAQTLKAVGPPLAVTPRDDGYSVATAGYEMFVQISIGSDGKISGLLLHPPVSTNRDVAAILGDIASAAPEAAYLLTKNGEVISEHNADAALAVGSAFKLAVLAVLNDDIVAGRRAWTDVTTIEPRQKSLPSGLLHTFPDGAPMTLYGLATLMISISDNTATDVLLDLVGRDAVARRLGIDFAIKTRELFLLKRNAALRARFLAADVAGKTALASEMDAMKLTSQGAGATDPLTNGVEWYVSLSTLCRLMGEVADLDLMQITTGPASRSEWDSVSYKGGSEVGVLNLTTQVTKGGSTYCIAATFNAPAALDELKLAGLYASLLVGLARE
ncbi:MAG: putative beta-lactamase [Devosia sp.]|nr:putative beta-lactamase [Devosia sp.]